MRPGRLDKIIYVGLPTVQDRLEILKTLTKVKIFHYISNNISFENNWFRIEWNEASFRFRC